ncbi:MAG: DUF1961 family protein [Butyrivibrio sp.]|nr:DUF1961 family protein [Butyrivibrio sp.]
MNEKLLYENPLRCAADVADFRMEGQADVAFPRGVLRLSSTLDPSLGQRANYVFWCPREFPCGIRIEWDFRAVTEPGLAILFFGAAGRGGESIFDPALAARDGQYVQYHHGDINAFHVSYFRRKEPDERAFHTCNLRKSYGFHLVSQGADPIPDANPADDAPWYHLVLVQKPEEVSFAVGLADSSDVPLTLFRYVDDGVTYGPRLTGGGCIGFRQLAPMVGEYRDLRVVQA